MPSAKTDSIKPRRLHPGAVIGVVAPASPFKRRVFMQGLRILRDMGYAVKIPPDLFVGRGYLAGTDEHRAHQLQEMFIDDEVDAVMCARGGFGALRMMPYLDWGLLRRHPKPFIGFSDITALHHGFFQKAGMVTFHGPVVCSLPSSDRQTQVSLRRALSTRLALSFSGSKIRTVRSGRAEGILLGGNLTTLCHLVGTPFASSFTGAVLFLEDTGEAAYRIDRMLTQMKLAGCFDGIKGVVLGSFSNGAKPAVICELVRQLFADRDLPILAGMAFGHGHRNLTLPMGVRVHLDADDGRLNLLECATSDLG